MERSSEGAEATQGEAVLASNRTENFNQSDKFHQGCEHKSWQVYSGGNDALGLGRGFLTKQPCKQDEKI